METMTESPENIGIYGGSFNPPHIGHTFAINYALSVYNLDQVIIVPCYEHVYGKKLISFEHRIKMCQLNFQHFKNVGISSIEQYLSVPNYTAFTVEAIKDKIGGENVNFHLILGEDCGEDLASWEYGDRLLELVENRVIVSPRINYKLAAGELSSTEVKRRLENGQETTDFLNNEVSQYIQENNLYSEIIYTSLKG